MGIPMGILTGKLSFPFPSRTHGYGDSHTYGNPANNPLWEVHLAVVCQILPFYTPLWEVLLYLFRLDYPDLRDLLYFTLYLFLVSVSQLVYLLQTKCVIGRVLCLNRWIQPSLT